MSRERSESKTKRGKRHDWKTVLLIAAKIVDSYDTDVPLRQLFYQLVSKGCSPQYQKRLHLAQQLYCSA